jgi:hypothetical protein
MNYLNLRLYFIAKSLVLTECPNYINSTNVPLLILMYTQFSHWFPIWNPKFLNFSHNRSNSFDSNSNYNKFIPLG